jgi:ADP-ribose pyrophosphatase YjhB (NUDIX family)
MKYRITPRGILIQDNKVLFASYQVKDKIIYALPGGKQETGESLHACLRREFKEELNLAIEVGALVLVKEFIHEQSDVRGWEAGIHQVELIFEVTCSQILDTDKLGSELDKNMLGADFLSPIEMSNRTYFPEQDPKWFFEEKVAIPYLLN